MRWPWTSSEPAQDDLDGRVAKLERQMTALQLEWSEVVDKLLHRIQRQAKRDRDAAKAVLETPSEAVPGSISPAQGMDRNARLAALRARHRAYRGQANGV